MIITWSGLPCINEEYITPEQYKTFFAIKKDGIKYYRINKVLGEYYRLGAAESIPYNELNEFAMDAINTKIENGYTYGRVHREGECLGWWWKPELTADDAPVDWGALSANVFYEIAHQLMNGEDCGEVII